MGDELDSDYEKKHSMLDIHNHVLDVLIYIERYAEKHNKEELLKEIKKVKNHVEEQIIVDVKQMCPK